MCVCVCVWGGGGGGGERERGGDREYGPPPPLKNHKFLQNVYVSLEILVQTPYEKQLDPSGPTASLGSSVRPSVKCWSVTKKSFWDPHH